LFLVIIRGRNNPLGRLVCFSYSICTYTIARRT